jgi:Ferredoxin-like domain in Api92-like protein
MRDVDARRRRAVWEAAPRWAVAEASAGTALPSIGQWREHAPTMPTEQLHRLSVKGSPRALARFRADKRLWEVEPWSSLFGVRLDEGNAKAGQLVYRYNDDWKRPGPSIAEMAAAYPKLDFIHEYCDEFGEIAGRTRYVAGSEVETTEVDPPRACLDRMGR